MFGIGVSGTVGGGAEQTNSKSTEKGSSNSATSSREASTEQTSSLEIERRRSVTTEYYLLPGHSLYRFDVHVSYKNQNWKVGMPLFEMRKTPTLTDDAEKMEEQRQAILAPPNVPFWFGVQPDFLTGAKNDDSIVICESRGYCAEEYATYINADAELKALGTEVGSVDQSFDDFRTRYAKASGKTMEKLTEAGAARDNLERAFMEMQYNHKDQPILRARFRGLYRFVDCCNSLGTIGQCFEKSPTFCGSTSVSVAREALGEHKSKLTNLGWQYRDSDYGEMFRPACEHTLLGDRVKSIARNAGNFAKGKWAEKYDGQEEHAKQLKLHKKEQEKKRM